LFSLLLKRLNFSVLSSTTHGGTMCLQQSACLSENKINENVVDEFGISF